MYHLRVRGFLDTFSLINELQLVFRKHRSTDLALLSQNEYIPQNFQSNNIVKGVFANYSEALAVSTTHY